MVFVVVYLIFTSQIVLYFAQYFGTPFDINDEQILVFLKHRI